MAVVFLAFSFAFALTAGADETGASATPVYPQSQYPETTNDLIVDAGDRGGSATAVYPANQNPETTGFFDLRVEAGQRQQIGVEISNFGDEPRDVTISLITANTNMNGIICYELPGIMDETLEHSFADIAYLNMHNVITIPPRQKGVVPIFINIPEEGFDGIILGSVLAVFEPTEQERAEAGQVINEFAFAIGVMLQERDTEITNYFMLGDVGAEIISNRAAIVAQIRNPKPIMAQGAMVSAHVRPEGSSEPIFLIEDMPVSFAPNSIFPLTFLDMAGHGLQPGDYLISIRLEHNGEVWEWLEEEFTIQPRQAADINTAAVNVQQQMPESIIEREIFGMPLWMIISIGAGVILIIVLVIVLIAKSRKSKRTYAQLQQRMEQLEMHKQPSQPTEAAAPQQPSEPAPQQPDGPAKRPQFKPPSRPPGR